MKGRNCPNCGAPLEVGRDNCSYCGTYYFDISYIPINEPFFLSLNVGTREHPMIVCQKVYTSGVTVTREPIGEYGRDAQGRLIQTILGESVSYELNFVGLGDLVARDN